jgi:phosphatidylglycerol---prolipoprotein diacylglyceryl transferase
VHPIMFRWRGLTIHSYAAMQYVGLVLGVIAGNSAAHAAGLDAYRVFIATCILLFPALAGARLLHVASHWKFYRANRSRIWDRSEGGAANYGGILVAVPLSIPLLRLLHVPFAAFWDVSMVTIMVGMIFTRIGCLLNGCCAGRPTDSWFGIQLPDHTGVSERRIPTQLLEAGWATVLLASAIIVWPSLPFEGALFVFVSVGYATGRLLLESTRNTSRNGLRFTLHHAISLLIIAASLAALTLRGQQ